MYVDLFINSYWNIKRKCMETAVDYYIYDLKSGDVYGDDKPDAIFLIGKKAEYNGFTYVDQITLIIQDCRTGMFSGIPLNCNPGYRPRLFLGDFNNDGINEILILIDSENILIPGSFYIFSYKCTILRLLFDYEKFNDENVFQVLYLDRYKVAVVDNNSKRGFKIDISNKSPDYLFYLYNEKGMLIKPAHGQVLNLSRVYPTIAGDVSNFFSLLTIQIIAGIDCTNTLGYVQTLLQWNGKELAVQKTNVSIDETIL